MMFQSAHRFSGLSSDLSIDRYTLTARIATVIWDQSIFRKVSDKFLDRIAAYTDGALKVEGKAVTFGQRSFFAVGNYDAANSASR
jgi:hypothetical protein